MKIVTQEALKLHEMRDYIPSQMMQLPNFNFPGTHTLTQMW